MIIGESSDTIFPIYLYKSLPIFKIFLKSVTLCFITHPYNPKYSRLQNKNRFHVNANGHLLMHCLLDLLLFINKMKIIR